MKRPSKLYATAALFMSGVGGFTQPTRAQDYPTSISGILCDTQAQLRTIVAADQKSGDEMRSVYQQLNGQLNLQNEPVCSSRQVDHQLLSVPMSVDLGAWPSGDQALEAYGLHIQVPGVDGWFMYLGPRNLLSGIGAPNNI